MNSGSTKDKFGYVTEYLLIISFFIFLFFISNSKLTGEDDLFWHLSTGRYILEHKIVPDADVFGFATLGTFWIPFEWGWDVLSYSIYSVDGFASLSLFSTVLIGAMFFILFSVFRRFRVNMLITFTILILTTFGMLIRLSIKPHLISYLFLSLILYIIIRFRNSSKNSKTSLYSIPIIFLIWINLHMGVLAGFMLFGIYILSELLNSAFKSPNRLMLRQIILLIIVFAASLLITLMNPHGIETYIYTRYALSMKLMNVIYEWQSPFSELYKGQFFIFVYYVFILGVIPVTYYSFKNRDLFPFLLFIAFFVYSARSVRFTADFMILTGPFIGMSIDYVINSRKTVASIFVKPAFRIPLIILLISLIFIIPGNRLFKFLGYNRVFGTGIENSSFPTELVEFMKKNRITEIGNKPFNTYENGGFFIWNFHGKLNFIDSRGLNDELWDKYTSIINMQPGFGSLLDSLGVDYVFWSIPGINYANNPEILNVSIISYFSQNPNVWKLIYWDDKSFLFVRNTVVFKNIIEVHSYNIVTPYNYYYQRDKIRNEIVKNNDSVKREMEMKIKEDPDGRIINAIFKSFEKEIKY